MSLKPASELHAFFSGGLPDEADPSADARAARDFAARLPEERRTKLLAQARALRAEETLKLEELGTAANRWFADTEEARAWLDGLIDAWAAGGDSGTGNEAVVVKDSNGAVLSEGDSVQVIKDLKVKGGSSDLKRGTMIRKIHLTGDSETVECRVDGSTLVLKTCFLKKA